MVKGKTLLPKIPNKVPEVRFNLKSVKVKTKKTLIRAIFRYAGTKFVYSTQHFIEPNNWNARTQKPRANYHLYDFLNNGLEEIKSGILEIYKANQLISHDELRTNLNFLLGRLNEDPSIKKVDFKDFLKSHIDKIRNGTEQKERTAQKYVTLLLNLNKFRPGILTFESIDMKFKNDFIKWRYNETKASSQNTINKDIECIKNILKQSFKVKLHNNDIFNDNDFSIGRVDTSIFALKESEVEKLYLHDFSDNRRLEQIRDWFLVSCWSALRWSDFSTLKPEHIVKDGNDYYLNKFTEKTNTEVCIPVDERLYDLLKKYNFTSIDISNQKFNDYLKEVFESCGITDKIIVRQSVKGKQEDKTERKCDIISAHDGRRTWATIKYLKGFPIGLLMQVTGHKKEETFLRYVGASTLDKARKLNELIKKG